MSGDPHSLPDRRHYDAIVIGAGSGGLTVAVGLGRFGRQVLLVEAKWMGGDCTNTGCIPSKSLLHLTSPGGRLSEPEFGDPGEGRARAAAVLAAVRARRDALRAHEVEEFGGADGVSFVYGRARLVGGGAVVIARPDGSEWTATADDVIVATGSSPRRLSIPGLPDERLLTNEELFELEQAPDHLAVVGGGAIGLEMALAFRRLGSQVTVVELADQILPGYLPSAAGQVKAVLDEAGIVILTGRRPTGYEPEGGRLLLSGVGSGVVDRVDVVLVAVGRVPNAEGLGLEQLGVERDTRRAVVVDRRGRTTADGVWALGDVATTGGTTHDASIWGRRIIQSIVRPQLPLGSMPLRPLVVFTDPEIATIGAQPESVSDDVMRITVDGSALDRSYTDEVRNGLLIVDVRPPTGRVLGATVVSPRAGEIISTFSLAMKSGIGFHRWYGTVVPYPTYSELITVAVEEYLSRTADGLGAHAARWLGGLGRRAATGLRKPW